jgi:hypothetical protein
LKMGRLLRCSSVTYRSGYAPSSRLADDPFSTQRSPRDLGDGALGEAPLFVKAFSLRDEAERQFA